MNKRPLKTEQIKLIQTAVRHAGLREQNADGRYRLLLSRYKTKDGAPCQSCKDLSNTQVDDLLAICEGLGWRHPGRPADFYRARARAAKDSRWATEAQRAAILHLAGDLGWTQANLGGMLLRMTGHRTDCLTLLTRADGYAVIEALKAILGRKDKTAYKTLTDAEVVYAAADGGDRIPF